MNQNTKYTLIKYDIKHIFTLFQIFPFFHWHMANIHYQKISEEKCAPVKMMTYCRVSRGPQFLIILQWKYSVFHLTFLKKKIPFGSYSKSLLSSSEPFNIYILEQFFLFSAAVATYFPRYSIRFKLFKKKPKQKILSFYNKMRFSVSFKYLSFTFVLVNSNTK